MIFAIISLVSDKQAQVTAAITSKFPTDHFQAAPDGRLFFVSSSGTAKDVSDALGITEGNLGSVIVVGVTGYFGRAPVNTWEWISAKIIAGVPRV
jgi:hypothetical protein